MTAPDRAAVPALDAHPHRLSDNVRFADLDVNKHVNNAVYSSYFESSRVLLVGERSHGLTPEGLGWVLARLDINFRAELHWPGTIDLGLGVLRLGRTSVTFSQVVYSQGRLIASAQATTVMVDSVSRKPTALPDEVIAAFGPWMLRGTASILRNRAASRGVSKDGRLHSHGSRRPPRKRRASSP